MPMVCKSRDQARRILEEGKDPAIEKKTEKLQTKLEQQAQLIVLEHQAARVTVRELYERWAGLVGLRVPSDVVERCLNHTEENKVKRIYQRQELKSEQAEAWRLLGARLDLLTSQDCCHTDCRRTLAGWNSSHSLQCAYLEWRGRSKRYAGASVVGLWREYAACLFPCE